MTRGPWDYYGREWEMNPEMVTDLLCERRDVIESPDLKGERVFATVQYIFEGGQRPPVEAWPDLTCRVVEQLWNTDRGFPLEQMMRAETLRTAALARLRA